MYILFVWLKFIKLSNHIRHCWSVVRVILYAESDKAMHEVIRPSTLNYLHHTRKMPIHWKLTYNHFTQKNSVAVDIQFCCLTDPQLFSDVRGCVYKEMHLGLWSWSQLQALQNQNQRVWPSTGCLVWPPEGHWQSSHLGG